MTRTKINSALSAGLLTLVCLQALPAAATPFSAVLPSSRSVPIGTTATAFATVLNPDSVVAEGCTIALATAVDSSFSFQTTDPATNEVTGTPDTAVDIAAGGSQSFVISMVPNSDFAAATVEFDFTCSTGTAISSPGINTLLLSGNTEPTADVVAVAATLTNDGIAVIPRDSGFGLMALATTNVGVDATITAQPVDLAGLDGVILICETDQDTADCIETPAASSTGLLAQDGTRTYSVFVNANTRLFLDATNNRTAVEFIDEFGNVRGATSIAIEGGGPSARTFFDDNIVNNVLQNTCTECHQTGGTAESSGIVFTQDFVAGFQDMNFAVLEGYLNADPGNADVLTSVVTGGQGHPVALDPMGQLFANVVEFLDLFATEPPTD